jgi:acetyltransferase
MLPLTVADEWHGRRVGSLLMGRLMALARRGGLERMEGYVLSSNHRMLGFARVHGFKEQPSPEGPQVRLVSRSLQAEQTSI